MPVKVTRYATLRRYSSTSKQIEQPPMRILYFGTCDFSVTCLRSLLTHRPKDHIVVVTPPDDPSRTLFKAWPHKEVPLKHFAMNAGLRTFTLPTKTMKGWQIPGEDKYDLGIVVSLGYFVPPRIIRSFKSGTLNVHPSLLPRYRGPAPLHHTLINGDRESGVSIIELHEKSFDSGRILKQVKVQVPEGVTFPRFHTMMARLGGHSLAKVVSHYDYYRLSRDLVSMNHMRQRLQRGTFKLTGGNTPLSKFTEGYWPLVTRGADIRLLDVRLPEDTRKEVQILLRQSPSLERADAGTILFSVVTKTLFVKCRDDEWLGVKAFQAANRAPMSATAFVQMHRLSTGDKIYDVKCL